MGDVASPQYPQYQPPQNTNLLSDPAKAIGVLSGLQDYRLKGQQFDALAQIPAAQLQTIKQAQQIQARQTIGSAVSNAISGLGPKATEDDVRNVITNLSRSYPDIATTYPDLLPAAKDFVLGAKKGDIQYGANMLRNSVLSPGEGSSRTDVTDPNSGAKFSVPTTTANMGGAIQTGLPQGSDESSRVMQAELAREGSYQSDINPLKKALDLAQKLGPGGMAPGSKGRQEFESFVYGLMPSLVPAGMQDKIKNYAELEKYLVNNASQRAQNLGPHTNEGLATATTGSPNVHINDLAGVDLIKAQLAIRNMEHAQVLQAAKAGGPNYTTAKSTFSAQHDPRAYAINTMSPEEIKNLQNTLKGPERAKFNQSLKAAIDSGVIERP